jgi:hypothetical protein
MHESEGVALFWRPLGVIGIISQILTAMGTNNRAFPGLLICAFDRTIPANYPFATRTSIGCVSIGAVVYTHYILPSKSKKFNYQ